MTAIKRAGELVAICAVALCFAVVIQAYAIKPYRIPSASMEPTLHAGQRIVVNRLAHRLGGDPKLGDVTVFTPLINEHRRGAARWTSPR